MKTTWIVLAEKSRARILSQTSRSEPLLEVELMDHPAGRLKEGELITDTPGRSFDSAGQGRHAMEPRTSARDEEAAAFGRAIVDRLERGAQTQQFHALHLAAPPEFLGVLRKALSHSPVEKLIQNSIARNLVSATDSEIRTAISG
jgi:protein required for attachment to host cells